MKTLLLLFCLISAAPVAAQVVTPVAPGSVTTLDEKNGFRKFRFGTPIAQLPGWERRARNTYVDPMELRKIGDVELSSLRFITVEDKFAAVTFGTNGAAGTQQLLAILEAQYGKPQQEDSEKKTWLGNKVTMQFITRTTYGAYNTKFVSSSVIIFSNESYQAVQDAQLDKAQKAGTGL